MHPLFCSLLAISPLFGDPLSIKGISVVPEGTLERSADASDPIDIQVPCDSARLAARLESYLGTEINEENLTKVKEEIEHHFAEDENPFVLVKIPEQNVTDGNVAISILPATVNNVAVSGNRWFSTRSIQSRMNVASGEQIQERDLLNGGAWINRNPFIHADVIVSKGNEAGTADVEIAAQDRFPARFYAGTDNTGTSVSGNTRFYTGLNWSLGLSNLFTYQFTSGYDFPEFLSHLINWTVFLPYKHEVSLYGGYATIHPTIDSFSSKGEDWQASMRYTIPFKPLSAPFAQQIAFGADYKQTNSSLFFLGAVSSSPIPVAQKRADLFQFYLSYQGEDAWGNLDYTFKIETLFSPFKFLPRQNELDYDSLRPGSVVRYIYARGAAGSVLHLPRAFSFATLFRAQVSSGPLLPSEQYGIGGFDTVRGYQERIYLADNAAIANFEIRSPSASFFRNKADSLIFLLFCDAAYGANWRSSPSYPKDTWLIGAGPGLRYTIMPYLTTRLDYGFRTHKPPFANNQIGRIHFSASVSY